MHMALSKIVILFWWEAQRQQELIKSACTVIGKTPKYRQSCHTDVTIWPEQEQGAQTPIAPIQMFIEEFILPVRVYRFLSDTYRCACATASGNRRRNGSRVHAHEQSQIYLHLMHPEPTDLAEWFWFRFEVKDDGRKSPRTEIRSDAGTSHNASGPNKTPSCFAA